MKKSFIEPRDEVLYYRDSLKTIEQNLKDLQSIKKSTLYRVEIKKPENKVLKSKLNQAARLIKEIEGLYADIMYDYEKKGFYPDGSQAISLFAGTEWE